MLNPALSPPLGALLAVIAFRVFLPERRTLTAKLFHDDPYVSTLRTELPAKSALPRQAARRR